MKHATETPSLDWPYERVCPVCGRTFVVPSLEAWCYRKRKTDFWVYFCRYNCLRKAEAEGLRITATKEPRKYERAPGRRDAIRRLILKGKNNLEIAKDTGASRQTVAYYRRRMQYECGERDEPDIRHNPGSE